MKHEHNSSDGDNDNGGGYPVYIRHRGRGRGWGRGRSTASGVVGWWGWRWDVRGIYVSGFSGLLPGRISLTFAAAIGTRYWPGEVCTADKTIVTTIPFCRPLGVAWDGRRDSFRWGVEV